MTAAGLVLAAATAIALVARELVGPHRRRALAGAVAVLLAGFTVLVVLRLVELAT